MRNIEAAKAAVLSAWARASSGETVGWRPAFEAFAEEVRYCGPSPIHAGKTREDLFARVYLPLERAFPQACRQTYLFLGGEFEGNTWVAASGDLVGAMRGDWLRIPASGRRHRVRFGEFYRISRGRVAEFLFLFDVLGLASQAGMALPAPFDRPAVPPPGPAMANGLCLGPSDPAETSRTLRLMEAMVGGCNRLDGRGLESMGMEAYWHGDMVWHGPFGIGSPRGFQAFQEEAQGPSVASFPDRRGGHHNARIADGITAAFTGWPSLRGTFSGASFHGLPPTGRSIGMNLMDFYVRRGNRLAENWVLIDLVDFWAQCGVDLLAATAGTKMAAAGPQDPERPGSASG